MTNQMRSRHLQMTFNLLVISLACAMSFAWLPTRAAALHQNNGCRIAVKAGWSPHRLEADDTLPTLAARGGVTVEELMAVNCLTSDAITSGSLLLTPKLGPLPTATPTVAPTAVPTPEPTPTRPLVVLVDASTPITAETSAAAETASDKPVSTTAETNLLTETTSAGAMIDLSKVKSEVEPASSPDAAAVETTATATASAVAEQAKETPVAVTSSEGTTPPSFPLGTNGLIGIALFIIGSVSALFFALQPRRQRAEAERYIARPTTDAPIAGNGLIANIVFMIGGFVIGALVFPMLRMPTFVELPSWLSASAAIGLIGLLAVKEVLLGAVQWRSLNRILNLGIAPLLMIFVLSVISRFAGMGH